MTVFKTLNNFPNIINRSIRRKILTKSLPTFSFFRFKYAFRHGLLFLEGKKIIIRWRSLENSERFAPKINCILARIVPPGNG